MVDYAARRAVTERRRGVARGPRARDQVILELLALTGLRASELARLQVGDVHLAARASYLRVRGGKARTRRDVDTVPLPWDLVPLLEDWTRDRAPSSPLFQAATSSRPLCRQEVWSAVKRCVRACELRDVLNAHSLRHYFVTTVALRSRSAATVARLARLRSLSLASTYIHVALEDAAGITGPLRVGRRRRRALPS
jgi:integrase